MEPKAILPNTTNNQSQNFDKYYEILTVGIKNPLFKVYISVKEVIMTSAYYDCSYTLNVNTKK